MVDETKKEDPFTLENQYSRRLIGPYWIETADILTVTLHWLQPHFDEAEAEIERRRVNKKKAPKPLPQDYHLPLLALWAGPVFLMLAGFALENLFKAYIVMRLPGRKGDAESQSTPKKKKGGSALPEVLKSHVLAALAKKTPLSFTKNEKEALAQLSAASVWWGRYPVPTSPLDLEHRLEDGSRRQTQHINFKSLRDAMALVRRVRMELFPHQFTFAQMNGFTPEKLGLPRMPYGSFSWDPFCSCPVCPKEPDA